MSRRIVLKSLTLECPKASWKEKRFVQFVMLFLGAHMLINEILKYQPYNSNQNPPKFFSPARCAVADVARLHGVPRWMRDEIEPKK